MARSNAHRSAGKAMKSDAARPTKPSKPARKEGHRETVEAFAVAFILAFLVKGFEAEAFVIPTGSMAPTLMGRHKEVTCPECGYVYAVNASEESESPAPGRTSARPIYSGICVNCRYQARIDGGPSFKGDRILVMKFPYDMPFLPGASPPERWDVVVFRYPEDPETSYIKRLVGLPGETLRIWHGDIFVKPPGGKGDFALQRKPLEHQRAMQMMVYDDTHRASSLKDFPEWRRWGPASSDAWSEPTMTPGTFAANPSSTGWAELRYRHLVPDPIQWRAMEEKDKLPYPPMPTLITDFYSYNTGLYADNTDLTGDVSFDQQYAWLQPHWVGDLTLAGRVDAETPAGTIRFELIEGGVSNRCEIDLKTGETSLWHGEASLGKASTKVSWQSPHGVTFANVDSRLTLWIDDRPVFGDGLTYDDGETAPSPTTDDLAPARIASNGAKVRVSDLVVKRDIYYTVDPNRQDYANSWDSRLPRDPRKLAKLLADPKAVAAFGPLEWADFPIHDDHFLMLGDNSPRSSDSRAWKEKDRAWDSGERQRWEVPRSLLTGKAFLIYWPHGKPFGPDWKITQDFRVPFRPYFERIKWIH